MRKNDGKQVHWDTEYSEARAVLPYFTVKKTISGFGSSRAFVLKSLKNSEYDHLLEWLENVLSDSKLREDFFNAEGHIILKYTLSYSRDIKIFDFIKEHFPVSSIKLSLIKENFCVLEEFFSSQAGAELFGEDDLLHRSIRVVKFKFLFSIDPNLMEEFINNNQDKKYMTDKVKKDFLQAKTEIKQSEQSKTYDCAISI